MITHEQLAAILHSAVTGAPDQAAELVLDIAELDARLTADLVEMLSNAPSGSDAACGIGDRLRAQGAPRDLVNECYRAAFYASDRPANFAVNPLFAHFLANKGGFVLDKWPHYFGVYDRYLSQWRGRAPRVLEIGVYRGGGLELLRDYFGPEATLVGVDCDPVAAAVASSRYVVELGDQEDPDFLRSVVERHGPFDVVIDDGGHTMRQQIMSASTLLPMMPDGSTYIVEDTHTSYWEEYGGGLRVSGTFVGWVKELVDQLHAYHWSTEVAVPELTRLIDAVHVHDSITVIDIGRRLPPFSEVVGTWDFLAVNRPLAAVHSELVATREFAQGQLAALQASRSSRLTKPLRNLNVRWARRTTSRADERR